MSLTNELRLMLRSDLRKAVVNLDLQTLVPLLHEWLHVWRWPVEPDPVPDTPVGDDVGRKLVALMLEEELLDEATCLSRLFPDLLGDACSEVIWAFESALGGEYAPLTELLFGLSGINREITELLTMALDQEDLSYVVRCAIQPQNIDLRIADATKSFQEWLLGFGRAKPSLSCVSTDQEFELFRRAYHLSDARVPCEPDGEGESIQSQRFLVEVIAHDWRVPGGDFSSMLEHFTMTPFVDDEKWVTWAAKGDVINAAIEGRWKPCSCAAERLLRVLPKDDPDRNEIVALRGFALLQLGMSQELTELLASPEASPDNANAMLGLVRVWLAILGGAYVGDAVAEAPECVGQTGVWAEALALLKADPSQPDTQGMVQLGELGDRCLKGGAIHKASAAWFRACQSMVLMRRGEYTYAKRTLSYASTLATRWVTNGEGLVRRLGSEIDMVNCLEKEL